MLPTGGRSTDRRRRRPGNLPGAPVPKQSRLITVAGLVLIVVAVALSLVTAQPRPDPASASPTQGALRPGVHGEGGGVDRPLGPGPGYWLPGADGGVFAYGRAHFAGSAAGRPMRKAVSAIAATSSGQGYWMAAKDGGVFAYGDAPYLGGVADKRVNSPVIGLAATPQNTGYWLAGADGGVFAFGDAGYFGGLAGRPLNQPIAAMAASPTGKGYWLVARDGGVFAFGDAGFFGGASGVDLNRGVVAIASTPTGDGYWLTGADGGVFAYGDAGYFGSAIGANPTAPIVGMARSLSGNGYWLAGADGGVFAYGDAGYYGSAFEDGTHATVVGIAAGVGVDVRVQRQALTGTFGWDVSWPQCGMRLPAGGYAFAVIGVTDGHQFSENPCLASQFRWALRHGSVGSVYMNVNWPSRTDEPGLDQRFADVCTPHELPCQLYWWGRRGVVDALGVAAKNHVSSPMWWLDVETTNRWSPDPRLNELIVKGAIDGLQAAHVKAGIYSTQYQWGQIVGGFSPGLPTWVAGPKNAAEAPAACAPARSFGGGTPWLVQFPNGLDGNIVCEAGARELLTSFRLPPAPAVPEF